MYWEATPIRMEEPLVPLMELDVNNVLRELQYQNSTNLNLGKISPSTLTCAYPNELPDNVRIVKKVNRTVRRALSSAETEEIIKAHTIHGIGVCQLARKYGCHHSTISKLIKRQDHI